MIQTASTDSGAEVLVALERRVSQHGSSPLLTWYDLDAGYRIELSGRTFANWVDKSANLLVSMDVDDSPRVLNTVLLTNPGHWVGLVWAMAVWQLGGSVVAASRKEVTGAELLDAAVVGPENPHPIPGAETIACSLHPLGAGFADRPLGVTDYAEVLGQSDTHWRMPATRPICFEATPDRNWSDLAMVSPSPDRRAIIPGPDPWQTVCDTLVSPVLGGGSVVVLTGGTPTQHLAIAQQERALTA